MAYDQTTPNYSWTLPTENGSNDDWGRMLNEIFGNATTGVDAQLKAVSDVADAAVPLAGAVTMTGPLSVVAVRNEMIAPTTIINWDSGNFFYKTLTGSTTLTFTNIPTNAQFITIRITAGGGHSVTWPAGIEWPGGAPPSQTSGGTDVYVFFNEGSTIRGVRAMEDVS